jgi:hypothetical protein
MYPAAGNPDPTGMRRSNPVAPNGNILTTAILPVFLDPDSATGTRRPSLDAMPGRSYRYIHLGRCKRACSNQEHN